MPGRLIVTPFNTDTLLDEPLVVRQPLITSYNLPPRGFVSVIRQGVVDIELCEGYWGYSPQWLKVLENSPYSARVESLNEKAMFKDALRSRCLIPVSGYYEWQQYTRHKRPFAIRRPENRTFLLAGIMTRYATSEATGYDTFALLTLPSNQMIGNISERMPVIIPKEAAADWLNPESDPQPYLQVPDNDYLDYYPVAPLVNNPVNRSRMVAEPSGHRFRYSSDA
ncbi:MAG: SOS response-associated peptidase [Oceanospirillum sp.]|nr:SOS response-associated peptidase [Oceanospirillum sp.]